MTQAPGIEDSSSIECDANARRLASAACVEREGEDSGAHPHRCPSVENSQGPRLQALYGPLAAHDLSSYGILWTYTTNPAVPRLLGPGGPCRGLYNRGT